MIGELENFGTVWYNETSLANILSMAQVRKVYRVTMDTNEEPAIFVHRKNGSKISFWSTKWVYTIMMYRRQQQLKIKHLLVVIVLSLL